MLIECTECGQQISSQVRACPQCGAARPISRTMKFMLLVLAAAGLGGVALSVVSRIPAEHSNNPGIEQHAALPAEVLLEATTRIYVARLLKSPSTAQFAPHDEWEITKIGAGTMRIRSWVDAKNPFGVPIRDYFTAAVEADGDAYRLIYFKFDSSDDAFGTYPKTEEEREADYQKRKNEEEEKSRRGELLAQRREAVEVNRVELQKRSADAESQKRRLDSDRRNSEQEANKETREFVKRSKRMDDALSSARFRNWTSLPSQAKAKIVRYEDGYITIAKEDGHEVKLEIAKLRRADHDYVNGWLKQAGISQDE